MGRHPQARHGAECPPPCGSHLQEKRETSPGGGTAPTLPRQQGGNSSKAKVRPAKPDMNLVKLEATAKAEELKARIRAVKMMSQGISYSQVVQAQAPVHFASAPTLAPAPAPHVVRTALTPDEAIAKFLETIGRLQLRCPSSRWGQTCWPGLSATWSTCPCWPAGVFPSAFKTALIHPVYKGGGKARNDPASYRPVAILRALSKVLETVAKEDLEAYMAVNNILPTSQHGFRRGRSCTTALATSDRPTNVLTK
jgi:hypothetical protein